MISIRSMGERNSIIKKKGINMMRCDISSTLFSLIVNHFRFSRIVIKSIWFGTVLPVV